MADRRRVVGGARHDVLDAEILQAQGAGRKEGGGKCVRIEPKTSGAAARGGEAERDRPVQGGQSRKNGPGFRAGIVADVDEQRLGNRLEGLVGDQVVAPDRERTLVVFQNGAAPLVDDIRRPDIVDKDFLAFFLEAHAEQIRTDLDVERLAAGRASDVAAVRIDVVGRVADLDLEGDNVAVARLGKRAGRC